MRKTKTDRMKSRLKKLLTTLNCLVLHQSTTTAYDSTIPDISAIECIKDICGTTVLPTCLTCCNHLTCAAMFGCGYDGAGETVNACATYNEVSKHVDEKHYRLT